MSSKARKARETPEKGQMNIRRVVHDVMMYTLQQCGLPQGKLPTTEDKENVYERDNFVEIAGVCTLRVALTMRDRWMRMFVSRRNSTGFNEDNFSVFLEKVAILCPLSYSNTMQSIVNTTFALCNEMILFFHREGLDIDTNCVISSTSKYVTSVVQMNPFDPVKIEDLFDRFGDLEGYAGWLSEFIAYFAVPYGSTEEVSKIFFEQVKEQWKMMIVSYPEEMTRKVRRGFLGYLPDDQFQTIETEVEGLGSESTTSGDEEPRGPTTPPGSPELGDVEESELGEGTSSGPASAFEQATQDEQVGKKSSELAVEDDLGRLSLGAEGTSQEDRSTAPERKRGKKKKPGKKKRS